jgi:hypothetical protein
MSLTYSYKIDKMITRTEGTNTGSVVSVYWTVTGTDENGKVGIMNSITPFSSIDKPAEEFIPYANLTEAEVIGWVQAEIATREGYQEVVNRTILDYIQKNTASSALNPLPWTSPT